MVQIVIFVKSVNRAKELNKLLVECNFPSICIHSAMKQEERLAVSPAPALKNCSSLLIDSCCSRAHRNRICCVHHRLHLVDGYVRCFYIDACKPCGSFGLRAILW